MKRIIPLALASAVAISLLGGSIARAQPYQPGPPPGGGYGPDVRPGPLPWGGPARPGWRHWRHGDRFAGTRYPIHDWRRYGLPPPAPGYSWARAGGEFVMLDGHGYVGDVFTSPNYP